MPPQPQGAEDSNSLATCFPAAAKHFHQETSAHLRALF
jgi:hypothetical protein